jgi:uncharacterized protein
MKIAFGELSREKSRYTVREDRMLLSGEVTLTSPLTAELVVHSKGDDTVLLEGVLSCEVRAECSRCGDSVAYTLDEKFFYQITTREEEVSDLQEKECSDEECETLYLKEPVIDVTEILTEQLYLALPGKVLCGEECRGLCPECGGSLNRNECNCSEALPDSPFAILKKLKKD